MHARREAFTLVELLVVAAIIAVLAGLVFGTFGKVTHFRQQTESASQLRQWGTALGLYLAENNGALPRRGQGVPPVTQLDRPEDWFNALPPYLGQPGYSDLVKSGRRPREGDHSISRRSFLHLALLARGFSIAARGEEKRTIRVAVIGGMTMTGMWQELATRFEADTGWKTELVITGPKTVIAEPFQRGEVDLLTMHSSDQTTDLVANGFGANLRPWARNEHTIVGPASGERGTHLPTASPHGCHVRAVRKIACAKGARERLVVRRPQRICR